MTISRNEISRLEVQARQLRKDIITMIYRAQSGHPGGSLSAVDIVTALYFSFMRINPADPKWPDRDRFILSKGHACPVWYAALARRGYFPVEELSTLRQIDSRLQGHPDMTKTPGLDMTTGSLGQGLSAGIGIALGLKLDKKEARVFVLLGDGELDEGQVWEAALAAAKFKLDNLISIIDYNNLQLDGPCDVIMPIEPIIDKWRAFNWDVFEMDGHNMTNIIETVETATQVIGRPSMILAHTIKGKGVSFMENECNWHGKAPNQLEYMRAMAELDGQHG